MIHNKQNIIDDIKRIGRVLKKKPGDKFAQREYLTCPGHRISHCNISDGGMTWSFYCEKAGYKAVCKKHLTNDFYFANLQKAIDELGRFPKRSEFRKYNLKHTERRWKGQMAFFEDAIAKKKVNVKGIELPEGLQPKKPESNSPFAPGTKFFHMDIPPLPVPPVPYRTKREMWIRTNISGFPYAPHDELGVAVFFTVLCSKYLVPWQVVELNGGSGIDCICYHTSDKYEIRVEFKYILCKSGWNHQIQDLDYVVCWENKWPNFPKPVLELKSYIKGMRTV